MAAQDLTLGSPDRIAMDRELHARSMPDFVRDGWHTLHSPEQPYVHNWHVDAICEHLKAVSEGQIKRLVINVPYGMSKSLLSTVNFPAWEWGPRQRPHLSYMCASYEMERLGKRDLARTRTLVGSEWYQDLYGEHVQVDRRNDTKEKFSTTKGGYRETRPIGGMTGGRADRVVIDDPHSTEGAESDAERERTLRIFSESIPSRLNNPRESAIIVIMQRLHERDVSGFILEQELGYDRLVLPMMYEPDHPTPTRTQIDFRDPRTREGELLFPARFPKEVVDADIQAFGGPNSYAAAGQLQQRPEPRGGGLIRTDHLERHHAAPHPSAIRSLVRYWDKAGTKGGTGAYTAGVLLAQLIEGRTPRYVVLDVVRDRWSSGERDRKIRETAEMDWDTWGRHTIMIEQEPGSGGKDSYLATANQLAGFEVWPDRVTGDKTTRAQGFASQVEAGNVAVLERRWTSAFVSELEKFPAGRFKDQADAVSGAFASMTKSGRAGAWGGRSGQRRRRSGITAR